jgi:hypothetical protein
MPIDQHSEGVAVAAEDRVDRGAFIDSLDLVGWNDR